MASALLLKFFSFLPLLPFSFYGFFPLPSSSKPVVCWITPLHPLVPCSRCRYASSPVSLFFHLFDPLFGCLFSTSVRFPSLLFFSCLYRFLLFAVSCFPQLVVFSFGKWYLPAVFGSNTAVLFFGWSASGPHRPVRPFPPIAPSRFIVRDGGGSVFSHFRRLLSLLAFGGGLDARRIFTFPPPRLDPVSRSLSDGSCTFYS